MSAKKTEAPVSIVEQAKDWAYKDVNFDMIKAWCDETNNTAWLELELAKNVDTTVYPRVKVRATNEDGSPKFNKKGKPVMVSVADKTQEPEIKSAPISFLEVRFDFFTAFMPDKLPKREKKLSMREKMGL